MNHSLSEILNEIILPLKLIIPQPIIRKIPGLTTNEDIRIAKALRNIKSDAKCLDIGCGDNKLIKRHRMRGGEGTGIDVYPWDGVDLIVEDSSKLPFEENSFDCVTFVASLNHIPNRAEVLKEV
ncbi:class I SAM-dependent methyltransferase [Candidatus Omnitrophota bacterium]